MSLSSVAPDVLPLQSSSNLSPAGWDLAGRPISILYATLTSLFATLLAAGLIGYWNVPHPANDFFAFHSFSRFIRDHKPALIYDQALLRQFQHLPGHKLFAFMYPPGVMLLVWPLAWLPYGFGYVLWIGVGLLACVGTLGVRRGGWALSLLLAVAPTTLWTILCGQSTLLLAGLIVGGLLLSRRRPLLAGLLIGLAAYKPQLGLLIPVALLAAGQWRTVTAAFTTITAVIFITSIAFGDDIWLVWMQHLHSITNVRTQHAIDWAPLLATVASDLAMMGADRQAADLGQAAASLMAVVCVWSCFRKHSGAELEAVWLLKVASLGAATFLATPFAFIYDLPLFTVAVLLFVEERRRSKESFHSIEILLIVAALLDPCVFLIDGFHGCGTLIIVLMLVAIVRRLRFVRSCHAT